MTEEERKRSLRQNFIMMYGTSKPPHEAAKEADVDKAKTLLEKWSRTFPALRKYVKKDIRV